jgi:nucleoside-diphosphate-sugar epimerase
VKVLLTGATGFIGRELVAQEKLDFRYVVRSPQSSMQGAIVANLSSETNWLPHLKGCEAIIHLAGVAHNKASDIDEFYEVNRDGTIKLARDAALAGVKRFVFVSSIGVNGLATTGVPLSPNSECNPHNDYARSKYEAEQALFEIAKETSLEVVIVRPTLVYGAEAPGNFNLLKSLVVKLPILPFGCATNQRDFISVYNLADLLAFCVTNDKVANQIILATESETVSTRQFTDAIAKGLNKKVLQLPIPVSLFRLLGKLTGKSAMIEQLFGDMQVDASSLTSTLGWHAPWSMAQSMAKLNEIRE